MTERQIEADCIEANISSEAYFTADEGVLGAYKTHNDVYQTVRHDDMLMQRHLELLTICVLVLKNGFTVIGESACVSRESFDADKGRKYARENAIEKIWPLMGYELRTKLTEENRQLIKKLNEDLIEGE